MDDTTLRARVNQLLKQMGERSIGPDEMKHALAQRWLGDYDLATEEQDLAETIADHCREWRSAPTGSDESGAPVARHGQAEASAENPALRIPTWWGLGEREIWRRYEPQRRAMTALFGLLGPNGKPMTVGDEDLLAIIEEVARAERPDGDWLLLEVPLGWKDTLVAKDGGTYYGLDSEVRPVWRGFHLPPPINRDGSLREATAAERASEQKLYRLAETAQKIADQTGCPQAEAVDYLLGGETPLVPYVDVTVDPRYRGYVIVVRDRRIPVRDVAAHYRYYRDLFGSLPRQPQEGPYLVVQFVEQQLEADPGVSWDERFERFEREHPGRYVSKQSFQQTYYAKRPSK